MSSIPESTFNLRGQIPKTMKLRKKLMRKDNQFQETFRDIKSSVLQLSSIQGTFFEQMVFLKQPHLTHKHKITKTKDNV